MGYRYDVFLSYNRKFPHGQWVDEIFYPLFAPYLDLQRILQNWVYDVASAITKVPEWDETWLTPGWLMDIPMLDFQPSNETKVRKPNL